MNFGYVDLFISDASSLSRICCKKITHTCEEGGSYFRIFFWYLLMTFEKPEKSEF